jgi:hypothetical protein
MNMSIPSSLINQALERSRNPEPLTCPVSGELMYAPLDKISIVLYNKSIPYIEDDSEEEKTLLELANQI